MGRFGRSFTARLGILGMGNAAPEAAPGAPAVVPERRYLSTTTPQRPHSTPSGPLKPHFGQTIRSRLPLWNADSVTPRSRAATISPNSAYRGEHSTKSLLHARAKREQKSPRRSDSNLEAKFVFRDAREGSLG
jgi:hypothetical protein